MDNETPGPKPCTRCGESLPVTEFREIFNKRTGKTRRHSWCNRCKGDYEAAKRAAKGRPFREAENARVLAYQADPDVKARRSKRSGAQYRALADLRGMYPEEYALLQLRQGSKRGYAATAALRDAHRDVYERLYSLHLSRVGLARD